MGSSEWFSPGENRQGAALGALWSQLWAFLGWYNAVQLATWPVGCGGSLGAEMMGRAPKWPKMSSGNIVELKLIYGFYV